MGEIAYSRPEGRVRVLFPDDMSLEHLRGSLDLNLRLAIATQDKLNNPPDSGREKVNMREPSE